MKVIPKIKYLRLLNQLQSYIDTFSSSNFSVNDSQHQNPTLNRDDDKMHRNDRVIMAVLRTKRTKQPSESPGGG
jgi:hypothetical protein